MESKKGKLYQSLDRNVEALFVLNIQSSLWDSLFDNMGLSKRAVREYEGGNFYVYRFKEPRS